jgi:hypothetical protein
MSTDPGDDVVGFLLAGRGCMGYGESCVEVDEGTKEALVSLMLHHEQRMTYQWPIIIPIRKQCTTDKQVDTRIRRGL